MDALEELRRNREARVNNIQKGFASDENGYPEGSGWRAS